MRLVAAVGVALMSVGCGGDFVAGQLAFKSSLSRDGEKWTPSQRIARGSEFTLEFFPDCIFNCPPSGMMKLTVGGAALMTPSGRIATRASGIATFSATHSGWEGSFSAEIVEPNRLTWEDPLVGAARQYPRDEPDGGRYEPAAVGHELVVYDGGSVLLELWAAHDAELLGTGRNLLEATGPAASSSSNTVLVQGVTQTVTLSLHDGGLATPRTVRAGAPREVVALELRAFEATFGRWLVHAVPRREDGGVMYGAPVAWSTDGQSTVYDYTADGPRLPRRDDVGTFSIECRGDAGTTITASLGALSSTVALPCMEAIDAPPPPAPTPRRGCSTTPGLLTLPLAAWLLRRRASGAPRDKG